MAEARDDLPRRSSGFEAIAGAPVAEIMRPYSP